MGFQINKDYITTTKNSLQKNLVHQGTTFLNTGQEIVCIYTLYPIKQCVRELSDLGFIISPSTLPSPIFSTRNLCFLTAVIDIKHGFLNDRHVKLQN